MTIIQRKMKLWKSLFPGKKVSIPKMDDLACERLEIECLKRKHSLLLEIKIVRDVLGRGKVLTGFSNEINNPLRRGNILIHEDDLDYLSGGEISYSKEEGSYVFFPNVDLVWHDSPRKNIKRLIANKLFTNKEHTWYSNTKPFAVPIQNILNFKEVVSLYAKNNVIQIEFNQNEINADTEQAISECILIYFSDLYPRLS